MILRLLGTGKSLELFCMGRSLSSKEAESAGIVTAVFDKEEFQSRVDMEMEVLAGMPTKVSNVFPSQTQQNLLFSCSPSTSPKPSCGAGP